MGTPVSKNASLSAPSWFGQWTLLVFFSPLILILSSLSGILLLPFVLTRRTTPTRQELLEPPPDSSNEGVWRKSSSDYWLYHRQWLLMNKTTPPRLCLVLIHGLGEHSNRVGYQSLARHLLALGIEVHCLEHLGHGRSQGLRAYAETFDTLINDQCQFIRDLQEQYAHNNIPIVVFAHSLGGLIALHVLLKLEIASFVSGLVLSSPAVVADPSIATPINVTAARILSLIAPTVGIDQLDTSLISRSSEAVAQYESDPLIFHGKLKARFAAEILRVQSILSAHPSPLGHIHLPLLVLHGSEDKIVPLSASEFVMNNVSTAADRKRLRVFVAGKHELIEDPEFASEYENEITTFFQRFFRGVDLS